MYDSVKGTVDLRILKISCFMLLLLLKSKPVHYQYNNKRTDTNELTLSDLISACTAYIFLMTHGLN